jgi:hypothetical protein
MDYINTSCVKLQNCSDCLKFDFYSDYGNQIGLNEKLEKKILELKNLHKEIRLIKVQIKSQKNKKLQKNTNTKSNKCITKSAICTICGTCSYNLIKVIFFFN